MICIYIVDKNGNRAAWAAERFPASACPKAVRKYAARKYTRFIVIVEA